MSRSLILAVLPAAAAILLTVHWAWIFQPQISNLRRQMANPKFAGTAHLQKLQYSLRRLQRRSVQLWVAILLFVCIGLAGWLRQVLR